jgi:predicted AAA+ superfamily ATPase
MLIENYAFIRLRTLYGNEDLRFWRTADGAEVDFVVTSGQDQGEAIEIKFEETSYNPSKYRKFQENYPEYVLNLRAFRASSNRNDLMVL